MNQLHSTAVALPYPRHLERPEPFSQRPVNDHSSVHPPRGAFDLRDGEALRLREELHFLHHGRTPPISLGFIGPQDSLIPTVPESLESRRDYHAQIFSRREGARASGKLDPHIEEGKHHAKRANLGSHNSFITYQWPSSEHESEVRRLGKGPYLDHYATLRNVWRTTRQPLATTQIQ
ncbi:hypothetical protein DFJ73DRAFT_113629 [Zopfochytrium polystomum]|nr:hypothetical protein DFJ73DRAFT_113629 [Zopfochytrium polystomum]